jgi:hypothetical protein
LNNADFLREHDYHFYIYAPKGDAFLRRRWQEPMPAETIERLWELSRHCRQNGIAFGIGLTPFEIYLNYDASARGALRSKVLQLNEIGTDVLCILFDDMRGDVEGIADLQASVIADVCGWSNADRFIICPTYYSYDWRLAREFGAPPHAYLRDLGRLVDSRIDFFWTGEKVISEGYSAEHLTNVAADMGRKPFIWDNYIANDSKVRTGHLYLDPTAGAWTLPADYVAGLAINPMNQPYLSQIALCGYRHLLTGGTGQPRALPSALAGQLSTHAELFQKTGLTQLNPDTRQQLLAQYEAEASNPYAQEVAAWLRGEYVFDPQCLTS